MLPTEGGVKMPTYDYRCTKCRRTFAVEQSIRDAALKKCKECGGKLEKLLPRSVNLIFKGPGFYATDYRKKPEPSEPKSDRPRVKEKTAGKGGKA